MLKIYDVQCTSCGLNQEQMIEDSMEFEKCKECGSEVKRIFSSFNFKLCYDPKKDTVGWAHNNYERSCYWDEVNKARQDGKDARPMDIHS